MRRNAAPLALALALAAAGAEAAAVPASPLASFDWTYAGQPPGPRHWSSPDGVVWTETYPDGRHAVQTVGAAARLAGCDGVITTKPDSPESQTFIPSPGCPTMVLLFRFGDQPWRPLGVMHDITRR